MMQEIKRVAAVIKPTQAMLDYLKLQPGINPDLTLESVQRDCTVLLLPAFESPMQAATFLKDTYKGLFEGELTSWGLEPSNWPPDADYDLFNRWFVVELHSVIFDIGDLEIAEKSIA